ncbi:MAG: sugar phosphate nucleotidyltransferase [Thermoanaerobaculia bacterium]
MKAPQFRALVLAAGFGTRLRPLTLAMPKPLLPVAGLPVLGHTLFALRKAGCEAVAVNLHYLGEKIASRFGSEFDGMPIRYSREDEILGTLGALGPLREFLSESDFAVVLNGDSLAHWPVTRLLKHHREQRPAATLMVSSKAPVDEFGGGIGISREGQVVTFENADENPGAVPDEHSAEDRRRVFAGAHVFSPDLLDDLPDPPADLVRDLYQPLVERSERIDAVESSELWFDIGTARRYLEGVIGWTGRSGLRRRGWWAPEAEVDASASVRRSVIEAGAAVRAQARVRRALVMSGASIGANSRVTGSIIGPSVSLPAGTVVDNRLVTEARADTPPDDRASVVGGLVYGPLE